MKSVMGTPRDEPVGEGTTRREPSGDGQRHSAASATDAVQDALTELQLALDLEFEQREALALAQSYPTDVLVAFFAEHTHIDADWLHRNGLGPEWLPRLYARWAAGAGAEERSSASGQLLLSRYTPRLDGGPYRAQRRFHPQDRTVFLHYSLPERYQPDAVLVRWVQEQSTDRGQSPGNALQHFDRHQLTGDIHQRQEAWMRPSRGWTPGDYRVERIVKS